MKKWEDEKLDDKTVRKWRNDIKKWEERGD
jgi:hypothetical protein